ncbi:MAG: flagellar hook assembly protein FlgD [Janthinobacterium lividum]
MSLDTSTLNSLNGVAATGAASATTPTKNDAASADRFLKLLVAQMQNQDPMNPMDNAQVTSQMAQINTVQGIQTLNNTVSGLSGTLMNMQVLQGSALVGHDVVVKGSSMSIEDGVGQGAFDLSQAADTVKVEVLDSGGKVVNTQQLGSESAGKHGFQWDASSADGGNYTFRVTATAKGGAVETQLLMRDKVNAVSTGGTSLTLELAKSGSVPYAEVQALN